MLYYLHIIGFKYFWNMPEIIIENEESRIYINLDALRALVRYSSDEKKRDIISFIIENFIEIKFDNESRSDLIEFLINEVPENSIELLKRIASFIGLYIKSGEKWQLYELLVGKTGNDKDELQIISVIAGSIKDEKSEIDRLLHLTPQKHITEALLVLLSEHKDFSPNVLLHILDSAPKNKGRIELVKAVAKRVSKFVRIEDKLSLIGQLLNMVNKGKVDVIKAIIANMKCDSEQQEEIIKLLLANTPGNKKQQMAEIIFENITKWTDEYIHAVRACCA